MGSRKENKNIITLAGNITEPRLSHESFGEKFYYVYISVIRKSGIYDKIRCIIPEMLINKIGDSDAVELHGEIRTRNNKTIDGRNKLEISVFVNDVLQFERFKNEVELDGYICRKPVNRETPLGRIITDIMIACNRGCGKTSYIPTILWGRTATRIAEYDVGTFVKLFGRMQSRSYSKNIDGVEHINVAYELSASSFEIGGEEE